MQSVLNKQAIGYLYDLDKERGSAFFKVVAAITGKRDYATLTTMLDFALSGRMEDQGQKILMGWLAIAPDHARRERHYGYTHDDSPIKEWIWSAAAATFCKKFIAAAKKHPELEFRGATSVLDAAVHAQDVDLALSAYKMMGRYGAQGEGLRIISQWGNEASTTLLKEILRATPSKQYRIQTQIEALDYHLKRPTVKEEKFDWNDEFLMVCMTPEVEKEMRINAPLPYEKRFPLMRAIDKGCTTFFQAFPNLVREHAILELSDLNSQRALSQTALSRLTNQALSEAISITTWRSAMSVLIAPPIGLDINQFTYGESPLVCAALYKGENSAAKTTQIREEIILELMEMGADPHAKVPFEDETSLSAIEMARNSAQNNSAQLMQAWSARNVMQSIASSWTKSADSTVRTIG